MTASPWPCRHKSPAPPRPSSNRRRADAGRSGPSPRLANCLGARDLRAYELSSAPWTRSARLRSAKPLYRTHDQPPERAANGRARSAGHQRRREARPAQPALLLELGPRNQGVLRRNEAAQPGCDKTRPGPTATRFPSSSATHGRSPTASAARPRPTASASTTPPSTSPPPGSSPPSSASAASSAPSLARRLRQFCPPLPPGEG